MNNGHQRVDTFVWDQNFITGLDVVDQQHRALVDLFNQLNASLFDGEQTDEGELDAVFQRLIDYANHHFADEEDLLREVGVDARHARLHHQMHQQFVSQVRTMWSVRETLDDPGEAIIGFLTSWLGLHILGMDQAMARQIAAIRQGRSSAEAFELETAHDDNGRQALLKMVGNLYQVLARQNANLTKANQTLEARVAQRTRALELANEELLHVNRRLEAFSRMDGLLRIGNRGYFDERLAAEAARAHRQSEPLGLLMMDVDFFKRYNDAHGHQAGDACLQAVARAVAQTLERRTDFLARYGGEELVVLLPGTDLGGAMHTAERVTQAVMALALPHPSSDAAPVVSISIGVASAVPDTPDAGPALVWQADAALYEAKRQGRNRAVAADATGEASLQSRH